MRHSVIPAFLCISFLIVQPVLAKAAHQFDHTQAIHLVSAGQFDEVIVEIETILANDPTQVALFQELTKSYAYLSLFDQASSRTQALYFDGNAEHPSLQVSGYCRYALFETMQQNRQAASEAINTMLRHGDPDNIYPGAPACATFFDTHWGNYQRAEQNLAAVLSVQTPLEQLEFLPWMAYVKRALGKDDEFAAILAQLTQTREAIISGAMDEAINTALAGSKDYEITQRINNWLAQVYTLEGDYDKALDALQKSYDAGALFRYHWWKTVNPIFKPLHELPEFQALLSKMENDIAPMRERVADRFDLTL